ncbi:MAG: hypothetical protein COS84_06495 [Armatimonadetes bacterium CG07_land_8_20_14_0_80_40_9]|nr:MAG: hypothetical protein COS84_06495 [Armatimonadetes bacterium CG07_land_8_20_14_0_80_40_9]
MRKLFITGVPVTGKQLIGREKELKQIKHLLQTGQSVILIAPRRFGKTSIILTILEELREEGHWTADIDLFSITNRRRLAEKITEKCLENRKLFNVIAKLKERISEVFKNVEIKQAIEEFEFVLKFVENRPNIDELLEEALDFPQKLAEKGDKDLYFFYDEFGDIERLDGEELIKLFRSKFQRHTRVCYIFAGSHESLMKEIFAREKSAFYKFGRIIYLGEIEHKDFSDYIIRKFKEEDISINENIVDDLLKKTRCHPYYTQLLSQQIHYILRGEKKRVEVDDLTSAYEEAFISEKTYLEKMWEELSDSSVQLGLLIELAKGEKKIYSSEQENKVNISRSLNSLCRKGIIKRVNKGEYSIIDPFFKEYLIRSA